MAADAELARHHAVHHYLRTRHAESGEVGGRVRRTPPSHRTDNLTLIHDERQTVQPVRCSRPSPAQ